MKKITPFIRFIVGGLYAIQYVIFVSQINISELDKLSRIIEIFTFLATFAYTAYCFKQGYKELNDDNLETPYLRILAILVELIGIATFPFIIAQEKISLLTEPHTFLKITGMGYLLIQDFRIAFGKD